MVEMAFVLPVYFLLCWGFLCFSYILFGYCNATYAAKMAVRYAAFHGSSSPTPCTASTVQAITSQYLFGAPATGLTVTSSWPNGNNISNTVTVQIQIVYPTGIPFSSLTSVTIATTASELILE